jgi:hypothetical protein
LNPSHEALLLVGICGLESALSRRSPARAT